MKYSIFTFFVFLCEFASAQENKLHYIPYENSIGFIKFALLDVDDEVEGGCWTNSGLVESSVRLELEREGVEVIQYQPAFFNPASAIIRFNAYGYRTNGGCAVTASFEVGRPSYVHFGRLPQTNEFSFSVWSILFERNKIFTSGTNNNQQILDFSKEAVTSFLADRYKGIRSPEFELLYNEFQWLKDRPKTSEEVAKELGGIGD